MGSIEPPRRLIIFDMDGTFIDNMSLDFDKVLDDTLLEMGVIELPAKEGKMRMWRSGRDHEAILESWGVRSVPVFWNLFDEKDYQQRRAMLESGSMKLFPEAMGALTRLRDDPATRLAVHTNSPARLADMQLEAFGLADGFFDVVMALGRHGYDQYRAKPEPWGVRRIQELVRGTHGTTLQGRTVHVGDSWVDVETARRAGIPSIQVLRDSRAPFLITTLKVDGLDQITPGLVDSLLEKEPGRDRPP